MRRKDREVTDPKEILEILEKCDTVRIGMVRDGYPYTVPVSFGCETVNGRTCVYFHCAKVGMKVDSLKRDPRVCVEADNFIKVEKTEHGITARYESVIGFGQCRFLTDPDEILHGLKLLVSHYGYADHPLERCKGLDNVLVGKIEIEKISGKRNLPET